MNINAITSAAAKRFNKAANRFMDSKIAHTMMPENPTDIAKTIALWSTTTKDAVNCYYYTTQSYTNEKIPEDKRKFVAGIDLANGILNVVTQFTLGSIVNKQSDKLFKRFFKGGFKVDDSNAASVAEKVNKYLKDTNVKNITCSPEEVKRLVSKTNKVMKSGFGVITVLLVTQIFAKRVIVPFLSTPLAGYFKKILDKREASKKAETPQNNMVEQQQQQPKKTQETQTNEPVVSLTQCKTFKGFEHIK